MEMTIEDAIKRIDNIMFTKFTTVKDEDAFLTAIDTMRKYQKIREIAFPLQFCSTDKLEHEAIMKICEVLEDGKSD